MVVRPVKSMYLRTMHALPEGLGRSGKNAHDQRADKQEGGAGKQQVHFPGNFHNCAPF